MPPDAEELARGACDWLLATGREDGTRLDWSGRPSDPDRNPTLYSGTPGVVLALLEAHQHFGDDALADAAQRGSRAIADDVEEWDQHGLYWGLAGMAFALDVVARRLGDPSAAVASRRALERVADEFDGERWGPQFELTGGNAGIGLAALAIGDVELAVLAVTPYRHTYETTASGVTWPNRPDVSARRHHLAHGTLGVAYALAATADRTGRTELLDLARAAVADVVSRNDAGADGFLVPHSDPQQSPERIERYNYGWCHGPAGDAQLFRLLDQVTGERGWRQLVERCWRTVLSSGLPERLRPGFWDNSGRCCGTAGVLALACDRQVETGAGLDFAEVLVADLIERATVDGQGARWSNVEFRAHPAELEPRQGWAMGNAGIVRELLRYQRIRDGRDPAYAVQWPDQPPAS